MKEIKSYLLLAAVALFTACSSDDASFNSNDGVTLGFADTELVAKESSGFLSIPITIDGKRNGDIKMDIEVVPDETNPAVEDVNYIITTKHLQLLNDTTSSETLNVEIKTIDDTEINDARKFKLKIVNVQGAKLTNQEIAITLRDNDAAFFEKFYGKWDITFSYWNDNDALEEITKTMTISGPSDENDPDYENLLTASCKGMFNVGIALDCQWHFRYTFDKVTKKGTLAFVLGETVATYSTSYAWMWTNNDGTQYTFDDVSTTWELGEGDAFPTTITWQEDQYVSLTMTNGIWNEAYKISMTKQ